MLSLVRLVGGKVNQDHIKFLYFYMKLLNYKYYIDATWELYAEE